MIERLLSCFQGWDPAQDDSRQSAAVRQFEERLVQAHDDDPWSDAGIRELIEEDWIRRNWENEAEQSRGGFRKEICDRLAEADGPILEIAAGPGGGNFPGILLRNPGSGIIVNDISIRVLRLWLEFLDGKDTAKNVLFAAFDAREAVLRDQCLTAISTIAGFTESGNAAGVLRHCHSMLEPGGRLCCGEMAIDPEDWARLPGETRRQWVGSTPGAAGTYRAFIETHGFEIETYHREPGRTLDKDEGELPGEASRHGVELHTTIEWICAVRR